MLLMMRTAMVFLVLCLSSSLLRAQDQHLYTYQQLSNTYYAAQKDSLKKAWVCPEVSDDRSVQRKFRTFWEERTKFLDTAIGKQHFIYEPEVDRYIQGIVDQLIAGSPQRFGTRPFLLIDRSSVVNAYALGGNVLVINLGMIHFCRTREELALVVAHELSHNLQHHVENLMKEAAEWLASDEYRKSVKAVLDSKYERYSRLKTVFEGYQFSRSRHQRYHESDADSLAILLLKNAHVAFKAEYFLRLDSSDAQYRQPLQRPLNEYFRDYGLIVEGSWMQTRARGLSNASYVFPNSGSTEDSLKTHPDCVIRYRQTLGQTDPDAATTPIPVSVTSSAAKMMIWNMFDDMNLTACLYVICLEKDRGRADGWYDFMLYSIFANLTFQDQQLNRFRAIGIKRKEEISKDYNQLQTLLEQIPAENLRLFCATLQQAAFWGQRSNDEKAIQGFLAAISAPGEKSGPVVRDPAEVRGELAEIFISNHANSLYREFVDHFKK